MKSGGGLVCRPICPGFHPDYPLIATPRWWSRHQRFAWPTTPEPDSAAHRLACWL